MVDAEYPGRVIIAEANQPPHEVVEYFGTEGNAPECHMAFHFPIMPRLYYALRDQKAAPIIDTMEETPAIPAGAQWGTFLRNHDELTLEMVTAEEREAMFGWYAPDSRMRANIGIRRRLAPLLDNSRAEIELINALLLSLPGSPFLYYGDEIGMGDNIWLEDRDAFRTPDAVEPRPQRRILHRGPGQAVPAGRPVAGVPLQLRERGGAGRALQLAAALGPADAGVRKAHPAFGLGSLPATCEADPTRAGLPARVARRTTRRARTRKRCCASSTSRSIRWPPTLRLPHTPAAGCGTSSAAPPSRRSTTTAS